MIWIARHGRTEANASGLLLGRADPSLDDEGRAQAAAIAASLPKGIRVISSPLARTRETAAAIDPDHEIDERLIELDYGDFDLAPVAQIPSETWLEWRSDPHFRPPGGETLAELGNRVNAALDELAAARIDDESSTDVVLVTHVSPIKAAVAWALDVGIEISWRCHVAQASISRINVSNRGISLQLFNDVSHLGA